MIKHYVDIEIERQRHILIDNIILSKCMYVQTKMKGNHNLWLMRIEMQKRGETDGTKITAVICEMDIYWFDCIH